jgi:hypothetical protein
MNCLKGNSILKIRHRRPVTLKHHEIAKFLVVFFYLYDHCQLVSSILRFTVMQCCGSVFVGSDTFDRIWIRNKVLGPHSNPDEDVKPDRIRIFRIQP